MLDPRRQLIVTEARTWLKTPFHHAARVKGIGVDCLTFIVEVFERVRIVPHRELPFYRPDFMHHQVEDNYLNGLLEHGHEVEEPQPADVAIFRARRVHAHAGIVTAWPRMIHAHPVYGVIEADVSTGHLGARARKFISAFEDGAP